MSLSLFVILFVPWQNTAICIQNSTNKRNKFLHLFSFGWHCFFDQKNVKKRRDKYERKIELEKCEKKRNLSSSRQNSSNGNGGNVSVVTISPIVNTSLVIDIHSPIWKRYHALRAYQKFYVGALFYIYISVSVFNGGHIRYTCWVWVSTARVTVASKMASPKSPGRIGRTRCIALCSFTNKDTTRNANKTNKEH